MMERKLCSPPIQADRCSIPRTNLSDSFDLDIKEELTNTNCPHGLALVHKLSMRGQVFLHRGCRDWI